MKNKKSIKFFSRIIITIVLTLGFSWSLQSVLAAWISPTGNPPLFNVNPPIMNNADPLTYDLDDVAILSQAFVSIPGNLGLSGGLTVSGLTNCDTIDTDASGNFVCGTDDSGLTGVTWAQVTGKPAGFDDDVDNVDDADSSPTNEIQNIINGQGIRREVGTNNFGLFVCSTGQILKRTATGWECAADATGLSSVAWPSITGMPSGFSDNIDNVNDADSNASNEIQTLSVSGRTISLSSGGGSITAPVACTWEGDSPSCATCTYGCLPVGGQQTVLTCTSGVLTGTKRCCAVCEGRNSCFAAGAQVLMKNGEYKNIEQVEIGDELQGADGVNTVIDYDRPIMTLEKDQRLMSINDSDFFITDNHPVMTTEGWKALNPKEAISEAYDILLGNISKLEIGDVIIGTNENILVKSIELKEKIESEKLYNFVLDGDKTYYVNDMLVLSFVPDKKGIYPIEKEH